MAEPPLPVGDALAIDVALLPSELRPERVSGRVAVVVDLLRFSTSLVRSFESGARAVYPVATISEASARVAEGRADLACGERGGVRPEGFHLGNSPLEYTPEAVRGRTLAWTTTNGTRALLACADGERVLVGALRNAAPLSRFLAALGRPILVVCAGTEGRFALEDALAAGAILDWIGQERAVRLSDGAQAALALWRSAQPRWPEALRCADHACTLRGLGFGADVSFAAEIPPYAPVPAWDAVCGRLTPLPPDP